MRPAEGRLAAAERCRPHGQGVRGHGSEVCCRGPQPAGCACDTVMPACTVALQMRACVMCWHLISTHACLRLAAALVVLAFTHLAMRPQCCMTDLPAAGIPLFLMCCRCALALSLSQTPSVSWWAAARPKEAHCLQPRHRSRQPVQAVLQRPGEGGEACPPALQQVPGAHQCGGREAGHLQAGRCA